MNETAIARSASSPPPTAAATMDHSRRTAANVDSAGQFLIAASTDTDAAGVSPIASWQAINARHPAAFVGAIRTAVTGQKVAPPIHYTLALLPKERALERLRR